MLGKCSEQEKDILLAWSQFSWELLFKKIGWALVLVRERGESKGLNNSKSNELLE